MAERDGDGATRDQRLDSFSGEVSPGDSRGLRPAVCCNVLHVLCVGKRSLTMHTRKMLMFTIRHAFRSPSPEQSLCLSP